MCCHDPRPVRYRRKINFFRLPFYTIESVHVVNARRRQQQPSFLQQAIAHPEPRSEGPLAADDTEIVLIRLAVPLDVDRRLLEGAR